MIHDKYWNGICNI